MVLLALPLAVLAAGGLVVDTASPDALCPPVGPTRELVAARLGDVELEGTWRATYVLVHRNEGDFVNLTLLDPSGASRLERQFPVQGGSCATLSQVIALVLERFFLRPGTEPREEGTLAMPPLDAPTPAAGSDAKRPAPAAEFAPDARPVANDDANAPRPQADAIQKGRAPAADEAWSVEAGLWVTNAWLAPSAQLERRVTGPFGLGLGMGIDLLDHEVPAADGWVRTFRLPLSLFGTARFARDSRLSPFVGVEVLTLVERAWTRGLPQTGAGTRIIPGLGLRAGAEFLGSAGTGPFAELTSLLLVRPASSAFQVDEQAVAAPPTLVFGGRFGIRLPF